MANRVYYDENGRRRYDMEAYVERGYPAARDAAILRDLDYYREQRIRAEERCRQIEEESWRKPYSEW
jgi:hypothetical protein